MAMTPSMTRSDNKYVTYSIDFKSRIPGKTIEIQTGTNSIQSFQNFIIYQSLNKILWRELN